jgi:hypothetical protein
MCARVLPHHAGGVTLHHYIVLGALPPRGAVTTHQTRIVVRGVAVMCLLLHPSTHFHRRVGIG